MPGSFTGPKPLRLGLLGLDGRDPSPFSMEMGGSFGPDQRGQHRDDRNSKQKPDCCEPVGYQARACPARVARSPFSPAHADRSSPLGSPLRLETATYPACRGQLGKAIRGTGGLSDDQCSRLSLAVILPPYNTRNRFQHMPDVCSVVGETLGSNVAASFGTQRSPVQIRPTRHLPCSEAL
jgi:hypothetical protein